jgi:hypothetical protein
MKTNKEAVRFAILEAGSIFTTVFLMAMIFKGELTDSLWKSALFSSVYGIAVYLAEKPEK